MSSRKLKEELARHYDGGFAHHAYLIEGDGDFADQLEEVVTNLHKVSSQNIISLKLDRLGIDESHALRTTLSAKAGAGGRLIFISASIVTNEAQNALLKTLEELGEGNTVFFVVSDSNKLLDTLLSRFEKIAFSEASFATDNSASDFISMDIGARMEFIVELVGKNRGSDEERLIRHKNVMSFIDSLSHYLHNRTQSINEMSHEETVNWARMQISDREVSAKMVLEHIAITLPRI